MQVSEYLQHLYRCNLVRRYCLTISEERKQMLGEKVVAESLFKDKKSSYAKSVPRLFDTKRLQQSATPLNGFTASDVRVSCSLVSSPCSTVYTLEFMFVCFRWC